MVSVLDYFVPISGTFDKIQQVLNVCGKIITSLASNFTLENSLFKTTCILVIKSSSVNLIPKFLWHLLQNVLCYILI